MARTAVVSPRIARNPKYPGLQPRAFTIGRAVFENALEHVLHQILRSRAIAGHPAEKIEEPQMMAVEQETQHGQVPLTHSLHQGFIGHCHPLNTAACKKGYEAKSLAC